MRALRAAVPVFLAEPMRYVSFLGEGTGKGQEGRALLIVVGRNTFS
jgi:hypothetical protein